MNKPLSQDWPWFSRQREGSIFSELDWWQQGLMRQALKVALSDLTPQGLARADAKGTAVILGP